MLRRTWGALVGKDGGRVCPVRTSAGELRRRQTRRGHDAGQRRVARVKGRRPGARRTGVEAGRPGRWLRSRPSTSSHAGKQCRSGCCADSANRFCPATPSAASRESHVRSPTARFSSPPSSPWISYSPDAGGFRDSGPRPGGARAMAGSTPPICREIWRPPGTLVASRHVQPQ
jgi:hypothetical protein